MLLYNQFKGNNKIKKNKSEGEKTMTGRTIKTRIYAGYKIEQKASCTYRFTITKGSKVWRTNEPKTLCDAMDWVDVQLRGFSEV